MQIDHLDPFALARRNAETSTGGAANRAAADPTSAVPMASPAGMSLAALPPQEPTMPDTHIAHPPVEARSGVSCLEDLARRAVLSPDHSDEAINNILTRLDAAIAKSRNAPERDDLSSAATNIEFELVELVATSARGVQAQLRLATEFYFGKGLGARLAHNVLTGIEAIANGSPRLPVVDVPPTGDLWNRTATTLRELLSQVRLLAELLADEDRVTEGWHNLIEGAPRAAADSDGPDFHVSLAQQAALGIEAMINAAAAELSPVSNDDDALAALFAERERLEAEAEADHGSEEEDNAVIDRAAKQIGEIDDRIADMTASTPEGLGEQVKLLQLLADPHQAFNGSDDDHSEDCVDRLRSSIKRGTMRLCAVFPSATGGDAEIRSLFQRWLDFGAMLDKVAANGALDDDTRAGLLSEWSELHWDICKAPATGAAGLAIKAFLVAKDEYPGGYDAGAANLGGFDPNYNYGNGGWLHEDAHALKCLIADAVRFVPEMAPLAEAMTSSPVRLPQPAASAPVRHVDANVGDAPGHSRRSRPAFSPVPESLAAAELEIVELLTRSKALGDTDEAQEGLIWSRISGLEDWIASEPPATLAEAAIKLRRLADPDIGMDSGDETAERDVVSVRQVLALIEQHCH